MFPLGPFYRYTPLQYESASQILGPHFVIGRQRLWSPLLENRSFIKEVGPVGDSQSLSDIMVGDDHADVLVFEFGDDVLDIFNSDGVDTGERLVKENEFRVNCESASDFTTSSLSSGELDSEALAYF